MNIVDFLDESRSKFKHEDLSLGNDVPGLQGYYLFPRASKGGRRARSIAIITHFTGTDHKIAIKKVLETSRVVIDLVVTIMPSRGSIELFNPITIQTVRVKPEDSSRNVIEKILQYLTIGHEVILREIFKAGGIEREIWGIMKSYIDSAVKEFHIDRNLAFRFLFQLLTIEFFSISKAYADHGEGKMDGLMGQWNKWFEEKPDGNSSTSIFFLSEEEISQIQRIESNLLDTPGSLSMRFIEDVARVMEPHADALNEGIIGAIYELSLLDVMKRKSGIYYTPEKWAWFTAKRGLDCFCKEKTFNGFENMRILDPAAGSGDFLIVMFELLVERMLEIELPTVGNDCSQSLLRFRLKTRILENGVLTGLDTNEFALTVTRLRFYLNTIKHAVKFAGTIKPAEIIRDDFLLHDFGQHKFDLIIGNPPYLMEVRKNQSVFRKYRNDPRISRYYEPKMDLFYFFMYRGIDLLEEGGFLSFVVQEYWLNRYHAGNLRRFIFTGKTVVESVLFKSYKVFATAPGHHSMIVVIKNSVPNHLSNSFVTIVEDARVEEDNLLKQLLKREGAAIFSFVMTQHDLYDEKFDKVHVEGPGSRKFFNSIQGCKNFYLESDEIQIGINIPQPYSKKMRGRGIFVLTREEVERLGLSGAEIAMLRPFHPATHLGRFKFTLMDSLFIIYTTNENMKLVEGKPDVYRRIRRHLDSFKEEITSDHKPYGLHRSRQDTWFKPGLKVIGVRKTKVPRFAVVPVAYYMDQSAIFVKTKDRECYCTPYYLCAFLNSSVAERLFFSLKTQGNQLQIDKSILLKVPIPDVATPIAKKISQLSHWLHVVNILHEEFENGTLIDGISNLIDEAFNFILLHINGSSKHLERFLDDGTRVVEPPSVMDFMDDPVERGYQLDSNRSRIHIKELKLRVQSILKEGKIESLFY
ncbi:MAG: Eco57I restriction-modification methylase domain-containing protein [Promethearchaeota archaeon]